MIALQPVGTAPLLGYGGADTLLLVTSSFERRCLGVAATLKAAGGYKAASVVLLSYSDRGDLQIRGKVRQHFPELLALLRGLSQSGRVEREVLEPYEVLGAVDLFRAILASLPDRSSIACDISTMSKLHVLCFLDMAWKSRRVARLRLFYTRAHYGRYDALSWGAEEPLVVPYFGAPRVDAAAPSHLLLFCGLEPERCYSVWRRFGRGRCTQIFIDAGDEDLDRCAERARRANRFAPDAEEVVLPAFQPDRVAEFIATQYRAIQARGGYLYISPLTTKWEVVGTWRFLATASAEANVAVVHAAAGQFNATAHTRDELGECLEAVLWERSQAAS